MDIKKKFETAKTKFKANAPEVIAYASAVAATATAIWAINMRKELDEFLATSCPMPKNEPHIVTNKIIDELLEDGKPQTFTNETTFDIEIQKKDTSTED